MNALYKMSFDHLSGNMVLLDFGAKFVEEHLWDFPITFLTTDFSAVLARLQDESVPESEVIQDMKDIHTFFEFSMLPLAFEDGSHRQWMIRWAEQMEWIQKEIQTIVDDVFLIGHEEPDLVWRFCRYLADHKSTAAKFSKIYMTMKVETVYTIGGSEFIPQLYHWEDYDTRKEIKSFLMFGTDDMEAALFLMIQRLAEQNIGLRKCECCGKYFHPFSVRTVYCDRADPETGKTCKEQAAKIKYGEKIAADEGRTLYQRRTKTYSMRVTRSPAVYKKSDYLIWKNKASDALEAYTAGKLSYEQLDVILALPERKGQVTANET